MKRAILILAAFTILGELSNASASPIYNSAADFSSASNPAGPWSYGYLPAGALNTASFALYTNSVAVPGTSPATNIDYWNLSSPFNPSVFHNPSNGIVQLTTVTIQPGQAGLHPGPNGEYSVYRFTAPATASYALSALFTGIDTGGTTTDVHVFNNGVALFNGNINGFGATQYFATTLKLGAGDRIDFVVGVGSNGAFFNDSTALDARLTAVPEPTSFALVGMTLAVGVVYGWRCRKGAW